MKKKKKTGRRRTCKRKVMNTHFMSNPNYKYVLVVKFYSNEFNIYIQNSSGKRLIVKEATHLSCASCDSVDSIVNI